MNSLRIAGSSTLSTGLPSINHSSSALRKAGTPWRPRREWRSIAARSATGDASRAVMTCPTAAGTAAGSTAPRSHSSRSTFVVGMCSFCTGLRSLRSRGRCTSTPGRSGLRVAVAHDHFDWIVNGSRNAPQVRRRAMRRERARDAPGLRQRSPAREFVATQAGGQLPVRSAPGDHRRSPDTTRRCSLLVDGRRAASPIRGGRQRTDRGLISPCSSWARRDRRKGTRGPSGRGASRIRERPRPDRCLRMSAPRCEAARRVDQVV